MFSGAEADRVWRLKDKRHTLTVARAIKVEQMHAIMQAYGYRPLDYISAAKFDLLSAQVSEIDVLLPQLAVVIDLAQRDLDAALAVRSKSHRLAEQRRERSEKKRRERSNRQLEIERQEQEPATSSVVTCKRWRDWGSVEIEAPEIAAPIVECAEIRSSPDHLLSEELDRRARAVQSWAPWERRKRRMSRRYEGFLYVGQQQI